MPVRPAAPPGSSRAQKRWLVGRADQPQRCFDRSARCSTRRPAAISEKDLVPVRHDHAHRDAGTTATGSQRASSGIVNVQVLTLIKLHAELVAVNHMS